MDQFELNSYKKLDEALGECFVCGKKTSLRQLIPIAAIDLNLQRFISKKSRSPAATLKSNYLCSTDLNNCHYDYVQQIVREEKSNTDIQKQVVESLENYEITVDNINEQFETGLTIGQRVADVVAEFGGSWKFIIGFGSFIITWSLINRFLGDLAWDPYPYILLNLCLSMLAAIQAPVIMMSQNRQDSRDRLRAESDYKVNMKAELEIRHLNAKLDHLLLDKWARLLEIQEIQTKFMSQIVATNGGSESSNLGLYFSPSLSLRVNFSHWTQEISPDPHFAMLLRKFHGISVPEDAIVFEFPSSLADNFVGTIQNLRIATEENGAMSESMEVGSVKFEDLRLEYEIALVGTAILDAIIEKEISSGKLIFRNNFHIPCLQMNGTIESVDIYYINKLHITITADELPVKYKPTLNSKYLDCLTDAWKNPIASLKVRYVANTVYKKAVVPAGKRLKIDSVDFCKIKSKSKHRLLVAQDMEWKQVLLPDTIKNKKVVSTVASFKKGPTMQQVESHRVPLLKEYFLPGGHFYVLLCNKGQVLIQGTVMDEPTEFVDSTENKSSKD